MTLLFVGLVVAIVAVAIAFIATRPAEFAIQRSRWIAAPPERIFPHLSDLRAWAGWSPWEGLDPNTQRTFGAASTGVGATYHWSGDRRVGEGEMTITEVRPSTLLGLTIRFIRPFQATNHVTFELTPENEGTTVTWTMRGRNGFLGKLMGLIINCDRLVGGQFTLGLEKLSQVSGDSAR